MDILHLIDHLEELFNESRPIPFTHNVFVDEDRMLDLIDQMRTAIPQEIRQGERIQQERERIVAQAEEEGGRIVQLARQQASELVDDHEVIQSANQRAKTIIERAQREAEGLKSEADEYVRGVLLSLRDQLGQVDSQIDTLFYPLLFMSFFPKGI